MLTLGRMQLFRRPARLVGLSPNGIPEVVKPLHLSEEADGDFSTIEIIWQAWQAA